MNKFFDSKDEKITEKVFSQNMIISVLSIVLCLVALCSITYAWFSGETTSNGNKLTSGNFDIAVELAPTEGDPASGSVTLLEDGTYQLTGAGRYTVTLMPTPDTTVKGYCLLTVDGTSSYKTDMILPLTPQTEDESEQISAFVFTLETAEDVILKIEAYWGIPAEYDVANGSTLVLNAPSAPSEEESAPSDDPAPSDGDA